MKSIPVRAFTGSFQHFADMLQTHWRKGVVVVCVSGGGVEGGGSSKSYWLPSFIFHSLHIDKFRKIKFIPLIHHPIIFFCDFDRFSITASYVGWIIYLITILVQEKTDVNIKKTCLTVQPSKFVRTIILLFFAILTIVVFTILYRKLITNSISAILSELVS